MNPLNKLRHDAALLGIEVLDEHTEEQLAGLISAAEDEKRKREEAEEAEAREIAAAADRAQREREKNAGEGAGGGSGNANAGEGGGAGGSQEGANSNPPPADPPINADALNELVSLNVEDVQTLRDFAKKHNIRLNPNKNVKAEKLLAAIRVALGA